MNSPTDGLKLVKIKPEAQDPGDEKYTWIVVEDRGNRVLIRPLETGLSIPPTMVVLKSDLVDYTD